MRKCSLMFAYVRLCSLNGRKIVESAARGHWGTGKTGRFQISHCEKFDIRLDKRRLRKCRRRCAQPPGACRKEEGRMQNEAEGAARGHCGLQNARRTEMGTHGTRPSEYQRQRLARTCIDFGRAGWLR